MKGSELKKGNKTKDAKDILKYKNNVIIRLN